MEAIASRDVQKNYGEVTERVTAGGECLRVTKYGRGAYYMIPDNPETAALIRKIAGRRFVNTLKSRAPNSAAQALTQQDINRLIDECFV